MSMPRLAPIAADVAIVERTGVITRVFRQWLLALTDRLEATATAVQRAIRLTDQQAAITTAKAATTVVAGLYRVSWAIRVTTVDSVSNSLTVTLGWVDGGVACTEVFPAITGNTVATVGHGSLTVHIDALADVTYEVAYGATDVIFALDVAVEAVG